MDKTNTRIGMSYEELSDAHFGLQKRYYELIMAVSTKHPNETRHETALRYIQEAEARDFGIESKASQEEIEGAT